jgi:hypothetical protein
MLQNSVLLANFCVHGDISNSIKGGKLIDQVRDYQAFQ